MKRQKLTFILTGLILLFLADPSIAWAAEYEKAIDAYNKGDYRTSAKLILPLAKKGFAKAQYNLGVMYEKGKGVVRDIAMKTEFTYSDFEMKAAKSYIEHMTPMVNLRKPTNGSEVDFNMVTFTAKYNQLKAMTNLSARYQHNIGVE